MKYAHLRAQFHGNAFPILAIDAYFHLRADFLQQRACPLGPPSSSSNILSFARHARRIP